jgi:hypothetical protein
VRRTFRLPHVFAGNTGALSTPLAACTAARPVAKEANRTDFDREGVSRPRLRPKGNPMLLGRQATSRRSIAGPPWLLSWRNQSTSLASAFRLRADAIRRRGKYSSSFAIRIRWNAHPSTRAPLPMNLTIGARRSRRFTIQERSTFQRGSGVNAALRFRGSMREFVRGILSPRERARVRGKKPCGLCRARMFVNSFISYAVLFSVGAGAAGWVAIALAGAAAEGAVGFSPCPSPCEPQCSVFSS